MNKLALLAIAFMVSPTKGRAGEIQRVYDFQTKHSLEAFVPFLESASELAGRPWLGLASDALIALKGDGHFTAWKFADLSGAPFVLDVDFEVPFAEDSNSGIFLLHGDPTRDLRSLPGDAREQYRSALEKTRLRREQLGNRPGPFALDYFAYEVQLARGRSFAGDPADKRTGTFYGVPIGAADGEQRIFSSYELDPGETYHLRITSSRGELRTYLRAVNFQSELVPVAGLTAPSQEEDAVRGGTPSALLLQAYWNNGTTAQSFRFKSIRLNEMK